MKKPILIVVLFLIVISWQPDIGNKISAQQPNPYYQKRDRSMSCQDHSGREWEENEEYQEYIQNNYQDEKNRIARESKETPRKIFKRWLKAAKNHYPGAQWEVAQLYEKGEGVSTNYVKSYYWYKRAQINSVPGVEKSLESLKQKMSNNEIEKGQKKFEKWLRKFNKTHNKSLHEPTGVGP